MAYVGGFAVYHANTHEILIAVCSRKKVFTDHLSSNSLNQFTSMLFVQYFDKRLAGPLKESYSECLQPKYRVRNELNFFSVRDTESDITLVYTIHF